MLTEMHIRRLRERGLDPGLAQRLGVRSTQDGAAILFDYVVRGQLHNTKIRRGKGNMPWEHQGKPLVLWQIDSLIAPPLDQDEPLIFTEGEPDALALIQAGWSGGLKGKLIRIGDPARGRVVSVPNGAPAHASEQGDKRFAYLYKPGSDELLDDIAKFGRYILAVDGDEKGQYLRDALAARLGAEKCLWVPWPTGCKDANDALLALGPQGLYSLVYGAKRMWLEHVARFSDIPDEEPMPTLTLGQEMMDGDITTDGIRLPQVGFVTVGGPAAIGKSTWLRQLVWHLWRQHELPFSVTAFEEAAKPTYQREFRRLGLGKDPKEATLEELGAIDIELDLACTIILTPPTGTMTVEQLLADIEYTIKVYGTRVVLVDPANEVERDDGPEATGRMIHALKHISSKYRILVIVATHPPIDVVRKKKEGEVWTLYDVESGRHWAGKSDAGFMMWRSSGGQTLLYCAKLKRWDELGHARQLYQLTHIKATNTFKVTAKGDQLLAKAQAKPNNGPTQGGYQRDD